VSKNCLKNKKFKPKPLDSIKIIKISNPIFDLAKNPESKKK
jgi:hypothetical protein